MTSGWSWLELYVLGLETVKDKSEIIFFICGDSLRGSGSANPGGFNTVGEGER